MIPITYIDQFKAIPITDYSAVLKWYEQLLGFPPTCLASDKGAVWELAEHRSVIIEQRPEHTGHVRQGWTSPIKRRKEGHDAETNGQHSHRG